MPGQEASLGEGGETVKKPRRNLSLTITSRQIRNGKCGISDEICRRRAFTPAGGKVAPENVARRKGRVIKKKKGVSDYQGNSIR